eukprot:gene1839-2160_t
MDEKDRPYNFVPKKFSCLRHVGGYPNFVRERFERCLDLYLCPRKLKKRLNIDPETLVPKLPKPSELKPFPNSLCLQYLFHTRRVRCISVSPDGQYVASGSDDCHLVIWEVDTCHIRYRYKFPHPVQHLSWNPNAAHHVVAAAVKNEVFLVHTGTSDADTNDITEAYLESALSGGGMTRAKKIKKARKEGEEGDERDDDTANGFDGEVQGNGKEVEAVDDSDEEEEEAVEANVDGEGGGDLAVKLPSWSPFSQSRDGDGNPLRRWLSSVVGPRLVLRFPTPGEVTQVAWHHKGDYLCTLQPTAVSKAVAIHQVSKGKSQYPFRKSPGNIQCVSFHPSRPFLFVATQQHVKVYHLVEQKLVKKLMS